MDLESVLIGAADSHARNLGKVVSLAFAAERAERQAVIERCLRRSVDRAGPASLEPDGLPTIACRARGWTRSGRRCPKRWTRYGRPTRRPCCA